MNARSLVVMASGVLLAAGSSSCKQADPGGDPTTLVQVEKTVIYGANPPLDIVFVVDRTDDEAGRAARAEVARQVREDSASLVKRFLPRWSDVDMRASFVTVGDVDATPSVR